MVANLVLPLRLLVIAAVVAPEVAWKLGVPLASAVIAGGAALWLRSLRRPPSVAVSAPALANPTGLRTAIGFAALYAAVLLFVAWFGRAGDGFGVYGIAAVTGMTDMDAVTLSVVRMVKMGSLCAGQAAAAVVVALASNSAFKACIIVKAGGTGLSRGTLAVMVAAAVAGLAIQGR